MATVTHHPNDKAALIARLDEQGLAVLERYREVIGQAISLGFVITPGIWWCQDFYINIPAQCCANGAWVMADNPNVTPQSVNNKVPLVAELSGLSEELIGSVIGGYDNHHLSSGELRGDTLRGWLIGQILRLETGYLNDKHV